MITMHNGRTYEVFLGGTPAVPTYYAHTHCKCGSTMSGGEWWPSIGAALTAASDNIEEHERACQRRTAETYSIMVNPEGNAAVLVRGHDERLDFLGMGYTVEDTSSFMNKTDAEAWFKHYTATTLPVAPRIDFGARR